MSNKKHSHHPSENLDFSTHLWQPVVNTIYLNILPFPRLRPLTSPSWPSVHHHRSGRCEQSFQQPWCCQVIRATASQHSKHNSTQIHRGFPHTFYLNLSLHCHGETAPHSPWLVTTDWALSLATDLKKSTWGWTSSTSTDVVDVASRRRARIFKIGI